MSKTADVTVPSGFKETMEENSWTDEEIEAWKTMHDAREGDLVLWADRTIAMEVVETDQDEKGHHLLKVEKPQAEGTYEVHERYSDGDLKLTSPIGSANNLHFAERGERPRGLDDGHFDDLVERQVENAVDAFVRMDYESWTDAVTDIVEDWSNDVALRRWRGYHHHPDWQDGDAEAIFRSVVDHADGFEVHEDDELSLREQAEMALHHKVYTEGRRRAEANIITSEADYWDLVEKLAHHTVDRIQRKSYDDARVATSDTISDWIDDRRPPAFESVIEFGENPYSDEDYGDLDPKDELRERAFDTLDTDVWEEVQALQRDRGEHDPTLRGLTYVNYQDLVDALVDDVLVRYDRRGFLRTTVKEVVEDWADTVEAHQWRGHRHTIYAAGDVEDIFASVAIHSEADPFIWNPFASDKERRMAVQSLTADVTKAAENVIDENQDENFPVPADEYVDDVLDLDGVSYDDLKQADPEEVDDVLSNVVEAVEGDEVGWTFVDEIIECGGSVPEQTNDWVLVDYGIVREGDEVRRLAWFDRTNGNVLVLSGEGEPPEDAPKCDRVYGSFHVALFQYLTDEPEFLLQDATLEEAIGYVYDYIGADRADFRVIETRDETLIQDQVTDEDINATGVFDTLVPNVGVGSDDIVTMADAGSRVAGEKLSYWAPELTKMAAYTILAWAPTWAGSRLEGVKVEPNVSQQHGVGTHVSKEFGAAPYEEGVGGRADVELNVRPKTFRNLGEKFAPKFLQQGLGEGDLGKGVVKRAGQGVEAVRSNPWGEAFLDEFGGSIESLEGFLKAGAVEARKDEDTWQVFMEEKGDFEWTDLPFDPDSHKQVRQWVQKETYNEVTPLPFDPTDSDDVEEWFEENVDGTPSDYGLDTSDAGEVRDWAADYSGLPYPEYTADEAIRFWVEQNADVDFSWDDFEQQDAGISGMMMRALDAKALTSAADFLNIDDWLENTFTFTTSGYGDGDPPSFDEWQQQRFGPGKPGGPEEEARRLARYHKEVAAATDEINVYEDLGIDEESAQGDYNQAAYDFDDTFGNSFEDVADKLTGNEPVESDHEKQEGHQ